jgi:subtilisin family serine protease
MARKVTRTPQPEEEGATPAEELIRRARATGTTGRIVMALRRGHTEAAVAALKDRAGMALASTADAGVAGLSAKELAEGGVLFHHLNIAVAPAEPEQARAVQAAGPDSNILFSRPERYWRVPPLADQPEVAAAVEQPTFAFPGVVPVPGLPLEYLLGYRDAIVRLLESLTGVAFAPVTAFGPLGGPAATAAAAAAAAQQFQDTAEATWGLQAIRVVGPGFHVSAQGRGVKVAILDSGLDLTHPDFQDGRVAATRSFVGQDVQDELGHGTHCAGIACGPLLPQSGRRYGVAPAAQLYIGKVATNDGGSADTFIFQGINWAVEQGCRVASMSLEIPGTNGQSDPLIDQAAQAALEAGTALIAAAGNDSRRNQSPPLLRQVGAPASSAFVMAVGAVDRFLRLAPFSNTSGPDQAGAVDIAGPGVNCYSSYSTTTPGHPNLGFPPGRMYYTLSGTSMATPHVAGVAALIAEQRPAYSAGGILNALMLIAQALNIPSRDVGKGLVRAPRDD